jgi:hypothetical protein
VIVCRQCGQQAREGEDFCESCGAFLEWEGERVDPAPPRPTRAPGTGAAPAAPAPTGPPPAAGAGAAGPPGGAPPGPAPRAAAPAGTPPPLAVPAAPPGPGASVTCLECGADNDGDRRFCRRCGSSLDLVALAGPPAAPPAPGPVPAPGALEGPVLPGGPPAR